MPALAEQTAAGIPDRGPAVFVVTTVTLVLASVFVASRMVSRIGIVKHVSYDDYIIFVAWVIAFFLSFTIDLGATRGLGRHDDDINPDDRTGLRKCEYVFSILYNPALMATKTSILVFYLRLSKNTQKILRMASWAVLIIVNVAGTLLTIMNVFQCRPVDASWNTDVRQAQCIPLLTEFICSAPVNIVTDLAILALPIPVITGMRLPPRQKTILVLTFAIGVFVAVVDVVRIYYLQRAITYTPTTPSDEPSVAFGDSVEFSWNASLSLMWSAVEVNIGIACACVPTLKPLVIRILPAMLVDPNRTHRSSQEHGSRVAPDTSTPKQDSSDGSKPQTAASNQPMVDPRGPPEAHLQGSPRRDSEEISIRDFLRNGAPGTAASAPTSASADLALQTTGLSLGTASSKQEDSVYFGFVNMKRPKSMLKVSLAESFKYCTVVTILFLLWGFSYGLLNTLNNVIAAVADMSDAQTLGLSTIYFGGGYFFGPLLVGEWLLRHDEHHRSRWKEHDHSRDSVGGFKTTFIAGLLIYGTGTIMFWPSAVLNAFGGFLVSSFVVGFGLGVLETAANPFLALCGPPEHSEMRLLLAQGVQGVGSVVSGLLAQKVFFARISSLSHATSTSLLSVQWTYLAITLFCVLLALFFYYMPLPEVSDKELGRLAASLPVNPEKPSVGRVSLRNWSIILAVLAQWTYVAAQESMSVYFGSLLTSLLPADPTTNNTNRRETAPDTRSPTGGKPLELKMTVSDFLLVAHTAFAVSRFATGYLAYLSVKHPGNRFVPTPRTMLTASAVLNLLFAILVVALRPTGNANLLFIPIVLFFLAEGPIWPLIFALGLRGQGTRTKRAAAWLTMGASGAGVWPFVIYGIIQQGAKVHIAFVVVVVLLVFTVVYPLFLTFVRDAKAMVDPLEKQKRDAGAGADGSGTPGGDPSSHGGLSRRQSQPSEIDLEEIIASRRRDRSRAANSGGGAMQKLRNGLFSEKRHRTEASTPSPPEVDHKERGDGDDEEQRQKQSQRQPTPSHAAPAAPWENQDLDTSILQAQ